MGVREDKPFHFFDPIVILSDFPKLPKLQNFLKEGLKIDAYIKEFLWRCFQVLS